MSLPLTERSEVLIHNKSREVILLLRDKLLKAFPRTWVMVHHDQVENIWGIEVANNWGNKVPQDKQQKIQEFIADYISSNANGT